MADIHVLERTRNMVRLVFHIPVADEVNQVGVSYREALVKSGEGGSSVLPDAADPDNPKDWEIGAAEKAKLQSGEIMEVVETMHVLPSEFETPAALRNKAIARYNAISRTVAHRLAAKLRFWGYAMNKQ